MCLYFEQKIFTTYIFYIKNLKATEYFLNIFIYIYRIGKSYTDLHKRFP